MIAWFRSHEALIAWLTASSVVMFVATLILIPLAIARIPADYFASRTPPRRREVEYRHPVVRLMLRIGKNLLGVVFILAGVAMLILPGQGVLTMLMGLLLLDVPGKYKLERWIVTRPRVFAAINWLRKRAGRAPLILQEDEAPSEKPKPDDPNARA